MLLAGSAWFVVRERGLSNELGRLQAEHQLEQRERRDLQTRLESLSAQAQALQTELDSERRLPATVKATGTRALIAEALLPRLQEPPLFVLATGLLRSGGSMARIAIPVNAPLIRLRLELPVNDHTLYRAVRALPAGTWMTVDAKGASAPDFRPTPAIWRSSLGWSLLQA